MIFLPKPAEFWKDLFLILPNPSGRKSTHNCETRSLDKCEFKIVPLFFRNLF